jgi:hypothetical protein
MGPARRPAVLAWIVLAIAGSVGVWDLAGYIETLTELGKSDRAAAAFLFRSRVLPLLWLVAAVASASGAVLAWQALAMRRAIGTRGTEGPLRPTGWPAPAAAGLAVLGIVLAAAPLAAMAALTWLLR